MEVARQGLPAVAFSSSGSSVAQVSYTTLANDSLGTTFAASYDIRGADHPLLLAGNASVPLAPPGTILNVNYPETTGACTAVEAFGFVLARLLVSDSAEDAKTCGTEHLPTEGNVLDAAGCFASVSVVNATNKAEVSAETQELAFQRLEGFLTCLAT